VASVAFDIFLKSTTFDEAALWMIEQGVVSSEVEIRVCPSA